MLYLATNFNSYFVKSSIKNDGTKYEVTQTALMVDWTISFFCKKQYNG